MVEKDNTIAQLARKMLKGDLDLLRGCWEIAVLAELFNAKENELVIFSTIKKEIEALPADIRSQVSHETVHPQNSDARLLVILQTYQSSIEEACEQVYEKFATPTLKAELKMADIQEQVVRLCHKMLEGDIDLLKGCWEMASLAEEFNVVEDEFMATFIVVKEEIGALPVDIRSQVSHETVHPQNRDARLLAILQSYQSSIEEACEEAYEKFITSVLEAEFSMVEIAKQILAGEVDLLVGCHWMSGAISQYEEDKPYDPSLSGFSGIESETELYPISQELRERYEPNALAKLDAGFKRYAEEIREGVYEDCRKIIKRFG